jgi:exopolyphosphatase/guanosine-5'-triphosphate,3'-diphosphate pyrophosphatase
VRSTIAPFAREVRRLGVEVAVGSSGTIANLAEMAALRTTGTRPRSVSNLVLTTEQLDVIVKDLVAAPDAKARAELPGIDASRADIILAGAVILEQVVHELDLPELIVSDYALREGVLLDTWQRRHGGSLHHLSDLRRQSVLDLGELMDEDPPHSAQVARLALELFDATRERHGLGDDAREILEAAALLCNVGMFLSHAQHHKHSYYVIRGTDRLAGFNDDEVERIALVARYHRKSEPKARHPEYAALKGAAKHEVSVLAGLLRVATGLDRNHAARVQGVSVKDKGERLVVKVEPVPGEDIALELYAATAATSLLDSALGVKTEIRQD